MKNLMSATFEWLDGPAFSGVHDPAVNWNGCAVPYFTKDEALRIAAECPDISYDEAADCFVDTESGEVCEVITHDGKRLHQLAPGWAWEVAASDSLESEA